MQKESEYHNRYFMNLDVVLFDEDSAALPKFYLTDLRLAHIPFRVTKARVQGSN